jgi:transcriptional regulator with XRE-family HTH domain
MPHLAGVTDGGAVPAPASPVVAAWELALRLRQRREDIGVEVSTITHALGFSRNYWSAVENERKILSEENLVRIAEILECDDEEREEFLELRRTARSRGWWMRYSNLLDEDIQRLYGLEAGAHTIRSYEPLLIPGLLQTDEYARALMTSDVIIRQVEIDQRVDIRLRRQQRLTDDNPLRLQALISEAVLCQQVGGPAVLRGQLDHLVNLIEELGSTLDVRVIPFTTQSGGLLNAGTMLLIEFESPQLKTVAWHELVTAWGIIYDSTKVRDLVAAYRQGLERALSPAQSMVLIRQYATEID